MKIPFFNTQNENNDSPANAAFNKVKNFFSLEPQKEKVLRHKDFNAAGDIYYANVSSVYKISQRVLVLILVVFLLFSVISNFGEITYDNFFYLFKDFSNAVDIESSNYDSLSYTSDTTFLFAVSRRACGSKSLKRFRIYRDGKKHIKYDVSVFFALR